MRAALEREIGELVARFGPTRQVWVDFGDAAFWARRSDRAGEVCMVIRRPNGRIIIFRKTFYPAGTLRLLTGGIEPGEPIEEALFREVAEETSLTVAIERLLTVIRYRQPGDPPANPPRFYTLAFLLREEGGTLHAADPHEQVDVFVEVPPAELLALAEQLEHLGDEEDDELGENRGEWGRFRAITHRVVAEALANPTSLESGL